MKQCKFFNALILSALSLTACTDGQTTDIQTQSLQQEVDDWTKVENIISAEAIRHFAANGLVLKGCEYLGEITKADFDELIYSWIADDAYSVADFAMDENSISFDVRKLKNITKGDGSMSNEEWREHAGGIITRTLIEHPDPVTVKAELFWNYKGLDFSTICAASRMENGMIRIVWDNIISGILLPPVTVIRDLRNGKWVPRSSQTRSDWPLQTGTAFAKMFPDSSVSGGYGASVEYIITVWGAYGRNGQPAITNGDGYDAYRHIYHPRWTADCQVSLASFGENMAIYHYAWAASDDFILKPVSITYRGPIMGYEVNGRISSDMCDSGTHFFFASDLQPVELDR